jgi:signal transduction histidine kinase
MGLVSIRDNGPGIPSEDLTRIFERFYRSESGRARADGGTGLGLSIAKKIAQAHGGNLTARNHQEGGAVFTLILPIN